MARTTTSPEFSPTRTPPLKKVLDGLGIAAGPLFRWPDGRIMHRFPRKAWARACVKAWLYIEKPDPKYPK